MSKYKSRQLWIVDRWLLHRSVMWPICCDELLFLIVYFRYSRQITKYRQMSWVICQYKLSFLTDELTFLRVKDSISQHMTTSRDISLVVICSHVQLWFIWILYVFDFAFLHVRVTLTCINYYDMNFLFCSYRWILNYLFRNGEGIEPKYVCPEWSRNPLPSENNKVNGVDVNYEEFQILNTLILFHSTQTRNRWNAR